MNRFQKWLSRVCGADQKIRELERREDDVRTELKYAQIELEELKEKHGQHCAICENSYKREQAYYMGRIWSGGYGCKLDIPCGNFKEKETPST